MAKKTTTDSKTLELINEVKRRKQEINSAEKPNWATNRNFSFTEDSAKVTPLHVEANVRNLVFIAGFLLDKQRSYAEAAAALGMGVETFTWQGFSVNDWLADIKLRVTKLQIASKKEKLEALESRLNSIISPELRAEMELEDIEALLKK